jgi:zinc D-Ala-D-Ala carboxypeptidase
MTRLSPNFTLHELLRSQTASRRKFDEQFNPPATVVDSLIVLCTKLLEPIRQLYGAPITISSGYRCPRLNKAVGGSPTSQHMIGEAADIDFGTREANLLLFDMIQEWQKNGFIEFDQLLNEFDGDWIHVSHKRIGKNRRQVLSVK